MTLISQLTALRAALSKISEWIQSDLAAVPQHHQLVVDLEQTVSCCQKLVESMDSYVSKLDLKKDGTLEKNARIRVVFQGKTCRDFQEFIQRQTTALNLLLSACNWYHFSPTLTLAVLSTDIDIGSKTASEQNELLEKSANRTIFGRIRDDSSSLIVLRDPDSILTDITHPSVNSSKFSRVFPFDTELTCSLVYQRAFRCLTKQHRSHRQVRVTRRDVLGDHTAQESRKDTSLRTNVFGTPWNTATVCKSKIQIAVLGDLGNTTGSFLVFLKMHHLAGSPEKAHAFKSEVFMVLFECIHKLLHDFKGERRPCQPSSVNVFRELTFRPPKMTQALASAISDIWQSFSNVSNSDLASSLSLPV